jgi:hypothetical protein
MEAKMLTLETVAEITEDGTLTARAPKAPTGRQRVVIVIDDALARISKRRLPDLAEFRSRLGAKAYPGNSVVDMRAEER